MYFKLKMGFFINMHFRLINTVDRFLNNLSTQSTFNEKYAENKCISTPDPEETKYMPKIVGPKYMVCTLA